MINQHNTTIRLVLLSCMIFCTLFNTKAQSCTYTGKDNGISQSSLCAPVTAYWTVIYKDVLHGGTFNVQIQFDWDDGSSLIVEDAVLTVVYDDELKRNVDYWTVKTNHIYPDNGDQCNYNPRANLIVNNQLCTSSTQEQIITVWDTDEDNGGYLSVTPDPMPICVGNDALFHFTDVSQWNCTPPDENDVINNASRWIQWIYGTGGSTITDAQINGVTRTYPYSGDINYVPGPIEAPIDPYNTTDDIYIPDHHPVGAFFEVTLRNWNICNPYDADLNDGLPPADLINGDFPPVTTTARAIIVGLPDASIQPVPPVCESADPFLLIAADGGGQWSGPGISAPGNPMFDPKLAGPGIHTIEYAITDGNQCSDIGTVDITVLAAPKADINQDNFTNLCPGIQLNLNGIASEGNAPYTHLWKGDVDPLSNTNISNPSFLTTNVGQYEIIYRVEDSNTCWNEDTITVDVEDLNIEFTNNNIKTCMGVDITIDPHPVGGSETYTFHLWTGARTDKLSNTSIQTPVFSADEIGSFEFEYTVRDSYGCEDSDIITITVHEQPSANAGNGINECGLKSTLNASQSIGSGLWKVIDGPGILTFEDFNIPNPTIVSDSYGTYNLRWIEDSNSCKDSAEVQVTFSEIPIPTVMEDKDTCGSTIQLIAFPHVGNGQWTKAEGSGLATFSNANLSTSQVSVNIPGEYKFAWTENNGNNCMGSDTVTINFFQVPVAGFTEPPAIECTPLEIQFENTSDFADTYYWEFSNGFISNEENPQQIFTNNTPKPVDYDITLIVRTVTGCADTISSSIKVAPTPIAYFEANNKLGCSPLETTFINKSQGGESYQWTFGDNSPMETTEHSSHNFINNESYIQSFEVMLVTTNSYSCTDTSRLYNTVYPRQDFNLAAIPDSGCSPLNVNFLADPGGYTYEWDFGDGNIIQGINQNNHLYTNNTKDKQTHKVQLYTSSFYGCVDTTETMITVLPPPKASFEPNDFAICSPKDVLFTNLSEDTEHSYWHFGDGELVNTIGTENIEHTYYNNDFAPKDYKIKLVVENSFGCKDSMDGFTSVNPTVVASISGDTTACTPFELTFGNQSIGASTYVWDYGDGNTSAGFYGQNIFKNNTTEEVEYNVSMIASSVYGCSDTAYVSVSALPSPKTNFEPNDFSVCSPKKVMFTNHTQNITKSYWSFGDGTINQTEGNESIEHTYINDKFTPLDYRIRLITENSFGCKDSMDGYTSVNPNVKAIITGSGEGCSPLEVNLGNESIGANSFAWDFGDGSTSAGYIGNNVFRNETTEDLEFEVSMIASSTYGCSDTATTSVVVFATPQPDFTVTPEHQQMPSSSVDINNLTYGDNWNYLWEFGDGNTSDKAQPVEHTYLNSGEYTIALKVYSSQCENTTEKKISILPNIPTVEYGPSAEGCPALTVDFYSNTLDAESFLWEFGDGNISSDPNPTHTYFTEGNYKVKLTVTGPGGQVIKDDIEIVVFPKPTAFFEAFPNVVTIPGEEVSFANKSIDATEYFWDLGDGNTSTEVNPVHEYKQAGNFDISLKATNEYGCTNEYIQNEAVTAEEGGTIEFPNAFTPNPNGANNGEYIFGDKNNYVFYPAVQKGVEEYKMQIYTRWGQLIFETHDLKIGWNGYHHNKLCSQGVYIWKVTCRFSTGQVKVYTGDVTLLR
ncbi:PKD domain-containing protein [Labilibacter sediminis]|nr:PKD domain-containing protein [Labilibacter sediminis]